jgi:ABC-type phosphate transport system substrate-binding protein
MGAGAGVAVAAALAAFLVWPDHKSANSGQGPLVGPAGNHVTQSAQPSSTGGALAANPGIPVCATGSLQLIGSTAFQPIAHTAADAYMQACPGAKITVTGGDAAYGVGQVQKAVRAHAKTAGSVIAMYDGSSTATAGLTPHPVGVLIFSLVAHTGLFPSMSVSSGQLRKIFVAPGEKGVVAVGRRSGSGTRKAFITNVLRKDPGAPSASNCPGPTGRASSLASCTEDSTSSVLSFVNGTPNAIGYAEVYGPLVGFPQVSVIRVDNAGATAADVQNGSYHFWTVEHLYAAPQPTALAARFLDFLPGYVESNPLGDFIACADAPRLAADC